MDRLEDQFVPLASELRANDCASFERRDASPLPDDWLAAGFASVGRLHGFDLMDHPLVSGLPRCPGQVLAARSTVPLARAMVGADLVVLFESGDANRPIVIGVIQALADSFVSARSEGGVCIAADAERQVITADREIVLRCGDASITLTRAGKVIIEGNYILSRSRGYNKIKGAAIDIN